MLLANRTHVKINYTEQCPDNFFLPYLLFISNTVCCLRGTMLCDQSAATQYPSSFFRIKFGQTNFIRSCLSYLIFWGNISFSPLINRLVKSAGPPPNDIWRVDKAWGMRVGWRSKSLGVFHIWSSLTIQLLGLTLPLVLICYWFTIWHSCTFD